jgi:hypothetical protein
LFTRSWPRASRLSFDFAPDKQTPVDIFEFFTVSLQSGKEAIEKLKKIIYHPALAAQKKVYRDCIIKT